MMRVTISIIIVSFNTREMTLDCVRQVQEEARAIPHEIIVTDNGSQDGSADALSREFPDVRVIASRRNLGFGAANNRAFELARGDFFLLLNSDAFLKPGAIRTLLDFLAGHPEVGIVGPRLLNADGSLQVSCYPFPSPFRAWVENLWISAWFSRHPVIGDYRLWEHDEARAVDYAIGACLLVRREAYEQVGGFDEAFFMYAEEADWEKRVQDAGWKVMLCPDARATHLGGASGANEKARINRHFFESLDYYERKHHGWLGLLQLRVAMVIGCSLRLVAWTMVWLMFPGRRELARGKMAMHRWLVVRQATNWKNAHPEGAAVAVENPA